MVLKITNKTFLQFSFLLVWVITCNVNYIFQDTYPHLLQVHEVIRAIMSTIQFIFKQFCVVGHLHFLRSDEA